MKVRNMHNKKINKRQSGFSLMELLIALLVTMIGLLGIAALQVKAQTAELESLQRAQALILLSDIMDKININREVASCFAITTNATTGSPYTGVGGTSTFTCTAGSSGNNARAVAALTEIDSMLDGAAATLSGADVTNVGSMIGARACISYDATTEVSGQAGTGLYTIAVSWQGMSQTFTPVANCANNTYGPEAQRRTVSVNTRIASLN